MHFTYLFFAYKVSFYFNWETFANLYSNVIETRTAHKTKRKCEKAFKQVFILSLPNI